MAAVQAEDEALDPPASRAAKPRNTPIAEGGLKQTAALYRTKKDIRCQSEEERLAHARTLNPTGSQPS